MSTRTHLAGLIGSVALFTAAPAAFALQVSPMVSSLQPSGSGASHRMSVKNTESTAITVEMQAFKMTVDEDGRRTLGPETDDVVLFPPQSVIPAGREQIVQVRYVGDAKPAAPAMYLVRVAQLPIGVSSTDSERLQANVLLAFTINTHLFVQSPGARGALEVSPVARLPNGDAVLTIRNTGDGVAQLRNAKYQIRTGSSAIELAARDVELGEVSALPPGATRKARIPAKLLKDAAGAMTVSVELL